MFSSNLEILRVFKLLVKINSFFSTFINISKPPDDPEIKPPFFIDLQNLAK